MNIFYDDLYAKCLKEDIEYFKKCGIIIYEKDKIEKLDISNFENNLYKYLENYKNMGFKFIELPEQMVKMVLDNEIFYCFGKSSTGYFVLNEKQEIYLLLNKYCSKDDLSLWFYSEKMSKDLSVNCYKYLLPKGLGFLFVNKSLEDFIESYSYLMMRIFSLKTKIIKDDFTSDILDLEAGILEKEIMELSPVAMEEGTYWNQMVFQISDNLGWLQLTPGLITYLKYT